MTRITQNMLLITLKHDLKILHIHFVYEKNKGIQNLAQYSSSLPLPAMSLCDDSLFN